MIGIIELLRLRGLDCNARIKLVRHQDNRYDIELLRRKKQIDVYQSYQATPIFSKCDYIVSFLGLEGTSALFYGVYKVLASKPGNQVPLPADFIYQDFDIDSIYYELREVPGFEDLKNRVVIDWGKGVKSWHQWLREKEVVEILPKGYVKNFPGYYDFILSYEELKKIIENPSANKIWHLLLSSVAGVYLITDTQTGNQYVGSAYGKKGVLGRWTEYAKNGHGGNQELKKLFKNDPSYADNFQFTILRTLPKTLTQKEVIEIESLYKNKLGTRAFGLNTN